MATNQRYTHHTWHVGETATPFTWTLKNSDGSARSDVASATFTLVDADSGAVLIDAEDCQSVDGGVLSYRPSAGEMSTACRFIAQFIATLDDDEVLPTIHIDGEIGQTLNASGGLVNPFFGFFKTPEDFGAVAGDTGDQSVPLQAWLDYCVANRVPGVIIGHRTYRYASSLQAGTGSAIATLRLIGLSPGIPSAGSAGVLHYTGTDGIGLALQGHRSTVIDGVSVKCDNTSLPLIAGANKDPDVANYVADGFSTSQYHPHAGIAIDPYGGPTPPGGGYPGKTYDQYTSNGITIRNCSVEGAVVGIFNYGSQALGSSIYIENCHTSTCVYAFATGQTQARLNVITNLRAAYFHTLIDGRTFNEQNGSAPTVNGTEVSQGFRLFNVNTTYDILKVRDMYAEDVPTLGIVQGSHPAMFEGCFFGFDSFAVANDPYYPIVHAYLACPTTFTSCMLGSQDHFWNVISGSLYNYVSYDQCNFHIASNATLEHKVHNLLRNGYTRASFKGCRIGQPDNHGWVTYNTNADIDAIGGAKLAISAHTRSLRTHGELFSYPASEAFIRPAWGDRYPTLSASGYSWDDDEVTFTAGTDGEFLVDDILFWRIKANQVNVPRSHVDFVSDSCPALKVTSVVGTTITAVAIGDVSELDTTYEPSSIYVAANDWVPLFNIGLTTTSGLTAATLDSSNHTIKAGDWVMASAGLTSNTRVISKTGTAVVLSKVATASGSRNIYCSRLQVPT